MVSETIHATSSPCMQWLDSTSSEFAAALALAIEQHRLFVALSPEQQQTMAHTIIAALREALVQQEVTIFTTTLQQLWAQVSQTVHLLPAWLVWFNDLVALVRASTFGVCRSLLPGDPVGGIAFLEHISTMLDHALQSEIQHSQQQYNSVVQQWNLAWGLLEHAPIAAYAKDLEGRYMLINRAAAAILSLPPEHIVGRTDEEVCPAELAAQWCANDQQVLATGRPLEQDNLIRGPNGIEHALLDIKFPIYHEGGALLGIGGIATNITERRRDSECLMESEHRYRAVSELISDYVYALAVEPDGQVRYEWATDALARITGFTIAELQAQGGCESLIHPDDRAIAHQRYQTLMLAQKAVIDFRIITRSGKIRWLRDYGDPIWDADQQRVVRIYGAGQDITERKLAQEALRKSEERFRAVWEYAIDAMSISDQHGIVQMANPAYYQLYGYSPQEVIGQDFALIFPEEQRAMAREQYRLFFEGSYQTQVSEAIVRRADGSERIVESHFSFLLEDGERVAMLSVIHDITERKSMEARLEHSLVLLRATLESTADGILVVSYDTEAASTPPIYNHRFEELWRLPPGWSTEPYSAENLALLLDQLKDPVAFVERAQALKAAPEIESYDVLELKDGRILERYGTPYRIGGGIHGRVWSFRDATERRRTEEEMRESRARLKAIFDNAAIGVGLVGPDGKYIEVNEPWASMLGSSREELLQTSYEEAWLPETRPESRERLKAMQQGNLHSYRREQQFLSKNKGLFWGDLSVTPIRDEAGRLTAIVGIVVDISNRKQAEAALQESEARYRALVESSADAIFQLSPSGYYTFINEAGARVLGKDRAEVIGKHLRDMLSPAGAEASMQMLQTVVQSNQPLRAEHPLVVHRQIREYSTALVPLHGVDGEVVAVVGIGRDITEREQMLEELRKLYRAVEQSPTSIVITDLAGCIEYVNPRFVQVTGYTFEEVRGKNPRILKSGFVPPEHYEALWQTILAGGEWHGEFHNRKRNGDLYWEAASISPVTNEQGVITHFVAVKEDITGRKQAEAEIQALNRTLERRADELEAVNAELEAFSSSVAHDLRTPLWKIDLLCQNVLEEYADRLDEEGKSFLLRINATTRSMTHLIDDLLNLANVTRGELRFEQVDLSDLVAVVALDLRQREPERQIELDIARDIIVEGDAWLLRIAMENLLTNAWKFTSRQPQARITFGVMSDGTQRIYFVRDNGAGFDPARADKLFGAFQRLHARHEFPGTGIGLTTVKRIISRHGGRVWAEGAVGQGATFYFTLR